MYTEMEIIIRLKDNVPEEVKEVLESFSNREIPRIKPRPFHPIWKTERLHFFNVRKEDVAYDININVKNYNYIIQKFLDWITPFLHLQDLECLGWYQYEEDINKSMIVAKIISGRYRIFIGQGMVENYVEESNIDDLINIVEEGRNIIKEKLELVKKVDGYEKI